MASLDPFDENGPIRVLRNDPVGTVEELRKSGLNPGQYASCHRPVKDADGQWEIRGCPLWKECQREEKGVSGPHNFGLRFIKQTPSGKRVVTFADSCMGLAIKRPDYEMRGILDVIAKEGESIVSRGSTFEDKTVPGEGLKRIVTDRTDMEYVIPKFPRPHENPTLAAEMFATGEVERETSRRKDAQRDKALGRLEPVKK